jgi:hypothetical protein
MNFRDLGIGTVLGIALIETAAAHADAIYVVNFTGNTIGEYTTDGATVNAALISGLSTPRFIAASGSDLFVTNEGTGTIGQYTTAGATVNTALITGLQGPEGIVIAPVPAPVIGHGMLVFLAVGGVLLGSKLLERRREALQISAVR